LNKSVLLIASYTRSLILFRGPLIRELLDNGYIVFACAPDNDIKAIKKLEDFGVKFISIPLSRRGLNVIKDLKLFISLCKLLIELKPDLLLLYTIKPNIYGSLAGYISNVKNIFSIVTGVGYVFYQENYLQKILSFFLKTLYKISLKKNKVVFFQNVDDKALFKDLGIITKKNKVVILNGSGVDLKYYKDTEQKLKPITFLLISRLIKEKGINEYIEAAIIIKKKYPGVIFQIIGDPEKGPSAITEDKLVNCDKNGYIQYLGFKEDVREYIKECSIYVLPSYREGTPRTVLEAMSMSRPIITTDAPGCRETVINGLNGFLVPIKNIGQLVEKMEKFILDKTLIIKMGDESRKIAERKYDVKKVNKLILEEIKLQNKF